jgi:hypothetical protein
VKAYSRTTALERKTTESFSLNGGSSVFSRDINCFRHNNAR